MARKIVGPVIGLPVGTKAKGVDFQANKFQVLAEEKGVRLAWSRAMPCPCVGLNTQTDQPGPNCAICKSTPGFLFFRPTDYVLDTEVGELTDLQRAIIDRTSSPSVVIKGVIQSNMKKQDTFDSAGQWVEGQSMISVRKENRIGHYDRFVVIDSEMSYAQLVNVEDNAVPIVLRFPALQINYVRSETTVYEYNVDYTCTSTGELQFVPGKEPANGSKLSVHYLHHPQLIVLDHPHAFRATNEVRPAGTKRTPVGSPQLLPIQAMAKLEFLL